MGECLKKRIVEGGGLLNYLPAADHYDVNVLVNLLACHVSSEIPMLCYFQTAWLWL